MTAKQGNHSTAPLGVHPVSPRWVNVLQVPTSLSTPLGTQLIVKLRRFSKRWPTKRYIYFWMVQVNGTYIMKKIHSFQSKLYLKFRSFLYMSCLCRAVSFFDEPRCVHPIRGLNCCGFFTTNLNVSSVVSFFSTKAIKSMTLYLCGGFKNFLCSSLLGKWSNLTNIFQRGRNHQPVYELDLLEFMFFSCKMMGFILSFDETTFFGFKDQMTNNKKHWNMARKKTQKQGIFI